MSDEYNIERVEDFLEIPPHRFNAMLVDFLRWYHLMQPMHRERRYTSTRFTWVDDGESHIELRDMESGATLYSDFPK